MSRLRRALLMALLLPAIPTPLDAQVSQIARVSGVVRDEGGKPVPSATVTASNPDQAPATLNATTDEKGRFAILGLRRGSWTFSVSAPGFQVTRVGGTVQAGRPNPPINITLTRGTPAPAGPAPTVTGAALQGTIDAAEAAVASGDLDTAIRNYRELVAKVPALTTGQLRLGGLLEQKGDSAGALDVYRQVLKTDPDNARASAAIARLGRRP
jgi:hypothetical protein